MSLPNSEALQDWQDQHADINVVLELVDDLVDMINEPALEKLRQRAKQISGGNLFITLHISIMALQEWQKRYELASKDARESTSKGNLSIDVQHVKVAGIQSRSGQLQVLGVAAAKTADASGLRRALIQVIEEIQQLRSWTGIFEQLLGRKVMVDGVGQLLKIREPASRDEECLGVESIASLAPWSP